jgi:hypothetical protein
MEQQASDFSAFIPLPRIQTCEQLHREIKETFMIQTIEAANSGYRFMPGVISDSIRAALRRFPATASSAYASRMLFH